MKSRIQIILLSLVFFIWGFMTVLNDILIPWLKSQFQLNNTASMTVQLSFFGAYFIGSFIFYILGKRGKDPVSLLGYKKTIALGLFISSVGTLLFIPASYLNIFGIYLTALFILGFGFTLLQISCNPFMGMIGKPEGATARLNLAQGFNSLGTTISPLAGGVILFGSLSGFDKIFIPYLIFTIVLLILAVGILMSPITEPESSSETLNHKVLHLPQVRWAMLAIFCYVGAEVTIGSKMVELLQSSGLGSWNEMEAKSILGIYWGGALTGRFMASLQKQGSSSVQQLSMILLGVLLMSGVLVLANLDGLFSVYTLLPFFLFTLLHYIISRAARFIDERQVALFAGVNILLIVTLLAAEGSWLIYIIAATGLFNSILWSHIFTLGVRNLKEKTGTASSLLVMMIVGGAIIPFIHGVFIDVLEYNQIQQALKWSYAIVILPYFFIVIYGYNYPKFSVK